MLRLIVSLSHWSIIDWKIINSCFLKENFFPVNFVEIYLLGYSMDIFKKWSVLYEKIYSRMDKVKIVEDSLYKIWSDMWPV